MSGSRTPAVFWAFAVALWLLLGPWVWVGVLVVLAIRPWRERVRPRWELWGWRGWLRVLLGAALVGGLVVVAVRVVPVGLLPIPPGPGLLVTPAYEGRPADPQPIGVRVPQHPGLAPNGSNSMHNDAWSSDAYAGPGPLGEQPEVDTAFYGIEECATLAWDARRRLIGMCGDLDGPRLRVIDPETMRPLATKVLPERPKVAGKKPWENLCAGAYFYLDRDDRAVVATTDRRVLVVATRDGEGAPALTTQASYDLSSAVPPQDCLVAVMPDWQGRIWFATQEGRVGTLSTPSGEVRATELGEEIANSFSVDDRGVYVVTSAALVRLTANSEGIPWVDWRRTYDRGSSVKPGQLTRGSGTTPTLLPGGRVAITDNADGRINVVVLDRDTGQRICSAPVFDADASATENSLVSVGDGVIVENNHGYTGPTATMLGRGTSAGIARVDVRGSRCAVRWTSEVVAPTSVPKVSLATGLLYVYSLRPSLSGVGAWYVTALDARTGRHQFSVRTGTGTAFNNHYAAVTLAPDGALWIATLTGLVRVRDRD